MVKGGARNALKTRNALRTLITLRARRALKTRNTLRTLITLITLRALIAKLIKLYESLRKFMHSSLKNFA